MTRLQVILSALALTVLMGYSQIASAGGATTYHGNYTSNGKQCFDYNDGYYVFSQCFQSHGEWNQVITPSGNCNFQSNGKQEYIVEWLAPWVATDTGSYDYHDQRHYKTTDDAHYGCNEGQVIKQNFVQEWSSDDGTTCFITTYEVDYQWVMGEFKFFDWTYVTESCS